VAPSAWALGLTGGAVMVSVGQQAGNFADPAAPAALAAQRALVDLPWTWLRQVHGSRVVVVEKPGAMRGEEADAAVTSCAGAVLAVFTADCAPIGLGSPEGVTGAVHGGWRGLMAGVVEATVRVMRDLGATEVVAGLGPCIAPHSYRFSPMDLEQVAGRLGLEVRSTDEAGHPSLDLRAAVKAALAQQGARLVAASPTCTHCSESHWSWRARADTGRQATVVWRRAT
jgi:YfiH family protein